VTTATQKLLGFQKRRLSTPPVVTRLKEAFDYRDLLGLFERTDCDDEFEEWGNDSLEWIVENFFPFLSNARVQQQQGLVAGELQAVHVQAQW
jgi:hypothetical protein